MRVCCLCTWLLLLIIRIEADYAFRDGDVRLSNGNKPNNGRVEVYYDGQWGTICDDGWDINDADVVCRFLGYGNATKAIGNAAFGSGSGPIILEGVECDGTESSLAFCGSKGWKVTDCQHSEDAGVECEGALDPEADKLYLLDQSREVSATLVRLFQSKWLCDFYIHVVTRNESESKTFCAHQLILGLNNNADFLLRDNATSYTMQVEDQCFPYAEEFIRYLYSKKIEVGLHSARCLHQMAVLYGIADLQEFCSKIISQLLPDDPTFETQIDFYNYAVSIEDTFLEDICLQYLAWNCETFTKSDMWLTVSAGLMEALLSRSDIVIESELALLQALRNWIISNNNTKPQTMKNLIGMIRFAMIPPESLYKEKYNLTVYPLHEMILYPLYIQAMEFHTVGFEILGQYVNFSDSKYVPRIYTSLTWSYLYNRTSLYSNNNYYPYNYGYYYNQYAMQYSFQASKHPSYLFTSQSVPWYASFYSSQQSCMNYGHSCLFDNFPVLSLTAQFAQDPSILYENKVVMICKDSYVAHVQKFKDNFASVPSSNFSSSVFPCSSEYSSYRYAIRPMYAGVND
ncbi:galectin-3-binding protein-like [Protopterus annectens]|uniref:galectin-3-binding protein-like n=1 Tax=Protopterus annectens TaxID=7888 RepID=UPI001CFA9CFD|nr:galectin-3-binding protein-like [Protopterus annectens]XP_043946451.1 galectin-3-binding protein-like [Protopterus annectens]